MEKKNLIMAWTFLIWLMVLSFNSFAHCQEICTQEWNQSLAGQASFQIASVLSLNAEQAQRIDSVAKKFRETFNAWLKDQDARRELLFSAAEEARTAGTVSSKNRKDMEAYLHALKRGRFFIYKEAFRAVGEIDEILTDKQKEDLYSLQLSLVVSQEVIEALKALDAVLDSTISELNETGNVSEQGKMDLQEAWQNLVDVMYLPDQLRERMQGRLLQAIKTSNLEQKVDAADLLPSLEKLETVIEQVISASQDGPVNPRSLLEDINELTGIGGRLLLLSKMGKVSYFELFMLTPAFSCQL